MSINWRQHYSSLGFGAGVDTIAFGAPAIQLDEDFLYEEFFLNFFMSPQLNSARSSSILNSEQHRNVSSPSQTDPPSLLF